MERLSIVAVFCAAMCLADERYIYLDQIQPPMDGYCLTVWQGQAIETFPLKVISIIRNQKPDSRNMILVKVLDKRFEQAGAIHGCSGSPVYIDGRLAGALAAGWEGCLEPLYLVRPIQDMLEVGKTPPPTASTVWRPVWSKTQNDLLAMWEDCQHFWQTRAADTSRIPLPLAASLPTEAFENWIKPLEKIGLRVVSAGAATPPANTAAAPIAAGGVCAAVLCCGDVNLAAVGTATEVVGDTVYAFGHSFLGVGAIQLPMAGGFVHSVIPTRGASFKLASPSDIVGTIHFDQTAGIAGTVGKKPPMIPLELTVVRGSSPAERVWKCQIACDRTLSPLIAQLVIGAATLSDSGLPQEHTVRYRFRIDTDGAPIEFENVSSGRMLNEMGSELLNALMLLLNNPFREIPVRGIAARVAIEQTDRGGSFWSASVEPNPVKAGGALTARLAVQSFRRKRSDYTLSFPIPADLPAGKYTLQIMGSEPYQGFLRQNAPWQFRVEDAPTLIDALNRLLNRPRARLYAVVSLPAGGVSWRRHILPDLPAGRAALMMDSKRIEPIEMKKNWLQQTLDSDWIIPESIQLDFTVEQPE